MRAADKKDIIGAFPSCAGAADKYGGNRDERSSVGRSVDNRGKNQGIQSDVVRSGFFAGEKTVAPTKTRATATRSFAAPHGLYRNRNNLCTQQGCRRKKGIVGQSLFLLSTYIILFRTGF